jgi:hypothetical protein
LLLLLLPLGLLGVLLLLLLDFCRRAASNLPPSSLIQL